jgi:hypothetical protein
MVIYLRGYCLYISADATGKLIACVLFIVFNRTFKLSQKLSVAVFSGVLTGFFASIFGIEGNKCCSLERFQPGESRLCCNSGAISFMIDSTRIVTTYVSGDVRLEPVFYQAF